MTNTNLIAEKIGDRGSGSPILFQMAIGILIFEDDRDRDRDVNFDDRAHAKCKSYEM